jgi:hypothetical protein
MGAHFKGIPHEAPSSKSVILASREQTRFLKSSYFDERLWSLMVKAYD